jgi:hypothetical protein
MAALVAVREAYSLTWINEKRRAASSTFLGTSDAAFFKRREQGFGVACRASYPSRPGLRLYQTNKHGRTIMRISRAIALAIAAAAPSLVSLSPAKAASECPATGTMSDWGVNSTGYFSIASGGTCLFPVRMRGAIDSSSISQEPAHGSLKRLDVSTYEYTANAGYNGPDAFAVTFTGKGPTSYGTSVITMNATVQ